MAFFDDMTRKLSQATQATAQKAKELADISRLNALISEEEKKITNSYYRIGKLFVALHGSDFEDDFEPFISSIRDSEQKIIDARGQIQEIKGVTKCEKCGAPVALNMAFCSSCGSPMPKETDNPDANLIKCISCGHMISKDMRFCTSCGKPMAEILKYYEPNNPREDTNPPAETASAEAEEVPQSLTCPGCGSEIDDEMIFCTGCGIKLK